ncbi:hypothetical protein TNCV_4922751 [Trichonephila clavipes]|nr:hypothetical protein TNCV_4922751 [Trichonephila clavipes]
MIILFRGFCGGEAGPCQKESSPPFTSCRRKFINCSKERIPRILFDDFCFFPRRPTLPQAGSSPLRASENLRIYLESSQALQGSQFTFKFIIKQRVNLSSLFR